MNASNSIDADLWKQSLCILTALRLMGDCVCGFNGADEASAGGIPRLDIRLVTAYQASRGSRILFKG